MEHNKGQSIVEVLIVALIISIALVASFSLFSQFYLSNQLRGEQTIATYLVVEGIELARNYMDVTRAQNPTAAFNADLINCDPSGSGCLIDINSNHSNKKPQVISGLSPLYDLHLYSDALNRNLYVNYYSGLSINSEPTPFSRAVYVSNVGNGGFEIVSRVDWQTRRGPQKVELKTYHYDYR